MCGWSLDFRVLGRVGLTRQSAGRVVACVGFNRYPKSQKRQFEGPYASIDFPPNHENAWQRLCWCHSPLWTRCLKSI